MDDLPAIEAALFREALGHYASGITVVTGMDQGETVGFTCQSFYSVSLEPPLVSFSVSRGSKSWPRIRPSGQFAITLLHAQQIHVSNGFARSQGDKWAGIDWTMSALGNPLPSDPLLTIECSLHAEHEAGDHMIVLGRVLRFSENLGQCEHSPLLYYKGGYRQLETL